MKFTKNTKKWVALLAVIFLITSGVYVVTTERLQADTCTKVDPGKALWRGGHTKDDWFIGTQDSDGDGNADEGDPRAGWVVWDWGCFQDWPGDDIMELESGVNEEGELWVGTASALAPTPETRVNKYNADPIVSGWTFVKEIGTTDIDPPEDPQHNKADIGLNDGAKYRYIYFYSDGHIRGCGGKKTSCGEDKSSSDLAVALGGLVALDNTPPVCSDGIDNDSDGKIDYPADLGCTSATDTDEAGPYACSDGIDNDADGLIDYGTGTTNDPGCTSTTDTDEGYRLTVSVTGSGSVRASSPANPDPNPPSISTCVTGGASSICTEHYNASTAVTLTATVPVGQSVAWTGCTPGTGNTCSTTMSGTKIVTAVFTLVNSASCTSISAPASVVAGSTFDATIVMQNNGGKVWDNVGTSPHRLGSQTPQDNSTWGFGRVSLPISPVNPGQAATFTFVATAPSTAGTYDFDWKMLEETIEWFGVTCKKQIIVTAPPPPPSACSDGIDNDGDGLIDYPKDKGCTSASDTDETDAPKPACSDGIDNDGDGLIDYLMDKGCIGAFDDDELDAPKPACSDGIDNDGDGLIDYPGDKGCIGAFDDDEFNAPKPACSDGIDNDADSKIDYPNDKGCASATDTSEVDAPTVDIKAWNYSLGKYVNGPITIASGQDVKLNWGSTGAVQCGTSFDPALALRGYTEPQMVAGQLDYAQDTGSLDYTITCENSEFMTVTDLVQVTVLPSPPVVLSSVTISASPESVTMGGSTELTWVTANVVKCVASRDWVGLKNPLGGTETRTGLTTNKTYTITCYDDLGESYGDTVTVEVVGSPTLNVIVIGGGRVRSSDSKINCNPTCTGVYPSPVTVTLTATPDREMEFAGWLGACTGTSLRCVLTMDKDYFVRATFDGDSDGDGLTDSDEGDYGTDPHDPDTDDGGIGDGAEVLAGTNPLLSCDDTVGGCSDDPGISCPADGPEYCPVCNDNEDNDGDELTDYGQDPNCAGDPNGGTEGGTGPNCPADGPGVCPQCNDGIDNTDPEDTIPDYPLDRGCYSRVDNNETDPIVLGNCPADGLGICPQCNDGVDNDGDGFMDWFGWDADGDGTREIPRDLSCQGEPNKDNEAGSIIIIEI